jgi:hypothetical protein
MLLSPQRQAKRARSAVSTGIQLRCPKCGSSIGDLPDDHNALTCPRCKMNMPCLRGVRQALLPEREEYFARFVDEYQRIRAYEGSGQSALARFATSSGKSSPASLPWHALPIEFWTWERVMVG